MFFISIFSKIKKTNFSSLMNEYGQWIVNDDTHSKFELNHFIFMIALLIVLTSSYQHKALKELTIRVCSASETSGCYSLDQAIQMIQSSTDPSIFLRNAQGANIQLTLSKSVTSFGFSECKDCTFDITTSAFISLEKNENIKLIVHGDENILYNSEYNLFKSAMLFSAASGVKEVTYDYKCTSIAYSEVWVCSVDTNDEDGNPIPGFPIPPITLINNGVTYKTATLSNFVVYGTTFTRVYFKVEELITDKAVCLGSDKDCVSPDEAIDIASKTTATYFDFVGDLVERKIEITPKESMKILSVVSCKGTISVKRNDVVMYLDGNQNLNLKLQGTGKFQRENTPEERSLCILVDNHGVDKVDFTFSDVGDVKEIYVALYDDTAGFVLPKFSASGDKKKYKLKTMDFVITESSKLKGDTTNPKVAYFEVSNGLSGGAIAGIVIACIVVVAGIAIGVFFVLKNKSKEASSDPGAKA